MANQFYSPNNTAPLSQQSFAANKPAAPPPRWNQPDQFVPGVGMMGPDLGGAVKGDLLRQQRDLAEKADARQEEQLGLEKENFGLKKDYLAIAQETLGINKADLQIRQSDLGMRLETHELEMQKARSATMIQEGLADAFKNGGYLAQVDFLANNGMPNEAITLQAAKLKLDDQIMQMPVMKAKGDAEIAESKSKIYAAGGAFAKTLMDTPKEEQSQMYQVMKPAMTSIFGEDFMPKEWGLEASAKFQMMIANATPAAQLYEAKKGLEYSDTEIGKLQMTIDKMKKNGMTMNDPGLKAATTALAAETAKAQNSLLEVNRTQMTMEKDKMQTKESQYKNRLELINNVSKGSERWNKIEATKWLVEDSMQTLEKDPKNSIAQNNIVKAVITGMKDGTVTEADLKNISGSNQGVIDKALNYTGIGDTAKFTPNEIETMSRGYLKFVDQQFAKQKEMESMYMNNAWQSTDVLGGDAPIKKITTDMPSFKYQQKLEVRKAERAYQGVVSKYEVLQAAPADIQKQAVEAIMQTNNPGKIQAIVQKVQQIVEQQQQRQQSQQGEQ